MAPRERRLTGQALDYWRARCDGRACPRLSDIEADRSFWDNTFLIDTSGAPGDYTLSRCGANLAGATGAAGAAGPGGRLAACLPRDHADNALGMCRAAVSARKPVASSDMLFDHDGGEILYRLILLPLSDDGQRVNALLGAASYKEVALDAPPTL